VPLFLKRQRDRTLGAARPAARDDEHEGVRYSYSQFHLEFALAAMYIAMLLTRWGEVDGVDHSLEVRDSLLSVRVGMNPIVAFVKQRLNMIGNLV
jgi:hypothetical protein